jgi:hypothetical protein
MAVYMFLYKNKYAIMAYSVLKWDVLPESRTIRGYEKLNF